MSEHKKAELFQYQLDINGLAGEPVKGWDKNTYDENGAHLGMHDDNLFDMPETASGDQIDAATGERYDNSTELGTEDLRVRDTAVRSDTSEDILPPLKEKRDRAAKWIAKRERQLGLEHANAKDDDVASVA